VKAVAGRTRTELESVDFEEAGKPRGRGRSGVLRRPASPGRLDASEQGRTARGYVGSPCEMVAGDRAGGRRGFAELCRATNRDQWKTDAEIARTVEAIAGKRYPTATLASLEAKTTHVASQSGDGKERGDAAASRAER